MMGELLTLPLVHASHTGLAADGEGDSMIGGGVATLIQFEPVPRPCSICGGPEVFVPVEMLVSAWKTYDLWRGFCMGCEQEKFVLIKSSQSEAA